jgi:acetolactate synthase I/II/III large subunit
MKASDYIVDFLIQKGINTAFVFTGGAIAHVIDSVAKRPNEMEYICVQNEQVAAMAAEAYSRTGEANGVTMVTSGPGATNLITGIVGAWYDCIPAIYITGQVRTWEMTGNKKTLQDGFQEVDICSQVKDVTKYAKTITNKSELPYELEKAYHLANSGRKGPVVIDLPMDIQWAELTQQEIDAANDLDFAPNIFDIQEELDVFFRLFKESKKPLILIGGGVKHANIQKYFNEFIKESKLPCVSTYAAYEILDYHNQYNIGAIGQFGQYCSNSAIEECDLLIALGTRFTIRAIGNDPDYFATNAKIVHVNIDDGELKDSRKKTDLNIHSDILSFLKKIDGLIKCNNSKWLNYLTESKSRDLSIDEKGTGKDVNPYMLIESLNKLSSSDAIIIPDIGWHVTTLNQQGKLKLGQQMFSSWANSPMGYAVAAGIGAYYSNKGKEIIIHIGDGGLQVNLQDLQTLTHYNIPLKIFLWNNYGYATIQAFQEGNLDKRYHATDTNHGYSAPNFADVSKLFNLKYHKICNDRDVEEIVTKVLAESGPVLCEVIMDIDFRPKPSLGSEIKFDNLQPALNKN